MSLPLPAPAAQAVTKFAKKYLNWARGTLPALTGLVILTPEPERLKTMLAGDVVTAARWEVSVWLQTPGKTPALPD
jgi:hypothetical protein